VSTDAVALPAEDIGVHPRVRALVLMLALTAGWLDALAFLALGRVLVSAVTGNVLFIGIDLADGNWRKLIRVAAAFAAYVCGAAVGAAILRSVGVAAWEDARRSLLARTLLLVVFAVLWTLTTPHHVGDPGTLALVAVAALATGIQGDLVASLGLRGAGVNTINPATLLLGASLGARLSRAPAPARSVPVWVLSTILGSYLVGSFVVGMTFRDGWLVGTVPAAIAIVSYFVAPREDPAQRLL
jgi:uncharacterized membrane protein YoaK (UPF0700 family)